MMQAKNEIKKLQPHDLIEYWGSYVADMEGCIEMDAGEWAHYLEDPRPALEDLLADHGTFPEGASYDEVEAMIKEALDNAGY